MAPEGPRKRRSGLGVAAYLLVPGERRRRAAGHFGRAALEAAKGVRALSAPSRADVERPGGADAEPPERQGGSPGRQRIEID